MNGASAVIGRIAVIAALAAQVSAPLPAHGADSLPLPALITPETQAAIDKGLEYLARSQSREGAWRHQTGMGGQYPVAMTSLAGLALLASGSTSTEGKYAPQISRAANFILNSRGKNGLISRLEEESRSMYGHGFSMLFLGQLYGMEDDVEKQRRIHEMLVGAVQLTADSQSNLGGWMYTPDMNSDEGSVTITQLQGLRSARNAGVAVPKEVIDKALAYLEKSSRPDGGIAYQARSQGQSRPPITAAAVACWYNAGQYDHPLAIKALGYIKERIGRSPGSSGQVWGHQYYAHLYMAQVMWLSGSKNWEWYFPSMRKWLLREQAADGSWTGDGVGTTYGTAIALVILQIPYGYLPILQK
jgi:hypothetical protein